MSSWLTSNIDRSSYSMLVSELCCRATSSSRHQTRSPELSPTAMLCIYIYIYSFRICIYIYIYVYICTCIASASQKTTHTSGADIEASPAGSQGHPLRSHERSDPPERAFPLQRDANLRFLSDFTRRLRLSLSVSARWLHVGRTAVSRL